MLLLRLTVVTAMAAAAACGPSSAAPDGDPADTLADTLAAMTFNIFHDAATASGRGNIAPWGTRRDLVTEALRAAEADVVGLQEAYTWQVEWLRSELPGYERLDGGSAVDGGGWSVSILFEAAELTLEESGHFWLSSTPDVPGSAGGDGWGWVGDPRIVSWARFAFARSGRQLYVYNAHLPAPEAGDPARIRSALLLADRIATRSLPDVPFVLLGDLNASEDGFPVRYLLGEASACEVVTCPTTLSAVASIDTWRNVNAGQEATRCRNDAQGVMLPETFGERVDYVLAGAADDASAAAPQVLRSTIVTSGPSCASDHFPVLSHLVMSGP